MKKIYLQIQKKKFCFFGNSFNKRKDFFIITNTASKNYFCLIFLDSRGSSYETKKNLIDFFKKHLKKKNFLIIQRPFELTTWSSLLNFLELNKDISYKYLITNMGFNDFTPKKLSLVKNALQQTNFLFRHKYTKIKFLESFFDQKKKLIKLYNIDYSKIYSKFISDYFYKKKIILINTPLLKKNTFFTKRPRPKTFIKMIQKTVEFNNKISTIKTLNFRYFSKKETYDGVHYTGKVYDKIFEALKKIKIIYA